MIIKPNSHFVSKDTLRLNLERIEKSLTEVQANWTRINDELEKEKVGRREAFDESLKQGMLSAYRYLDDLLAWEIEPFSLRSVPAILELNCRIHYGTNYALRREYHTAIEATKEKFDRLIGVLLKWYAKHEKKNDSPLKIASEIYAGILGSPQLFIEGNHRTGSLVASWINLYHGYPPFVLSPENAIAYFVPSSEIKHFESKSFWRKKGTLLPRYHKSFKSFWESNIRWKYVLRDTA